MYPLSYSVLCTILYPFAGRIKTLIVSIVGAAIWGFHHTVQHWAPARIWPSSKM